MWNLDIVDCTNDLEEYRCPECPDFKSNFLVDVRQHVRNGHRGANSKEVLYKCLKCHLVAHSKYVLLRHSISSTCALVNANERQRRFVCCGTVNLENNCGLDHDYCVKKRYQQVPLDHDLECRRFLSEIRSTMREPEPSSERKLGDIWLCDMCPRHFYYKQALEQHTQQCHGSPVIKWFKCAECFYTCRRRDRFAQHALVHAHSENVQWFQCGKCPLKFRQNRALGAHIKAVHSKPGTSHCGHSPFKFKQNRALNTHVRSHSEDSQWFQCDQCPSKFKHKYFWESHVIVRHSITWLHCTLCPVAFNTKDNLKRHMIAHHPEWNGSDVDK